MRFTAFILLPPLVIALSLCAAQASTQVDFESQIRPLFARHCIRCHGPEQQESNLRLDQRIAMIRGGDSGVPTIVPGKPAESFLLDAVRGTDPDFKMPPEGGLLSAEQIALLDDWIAAGAQWPGQMHAKALPTKSAHWSLQPMVLPPIPAITGPAISGSAVTGTNGNPIDAFILRELAAHQLALQASADRRTLLRRVTLDLTGLPPTIEAIDAFLHDEASNDAAYLKVVQRLLASSHYGERWAQHWLDVIRWGETVGFETNAERADAWHYRDWVIRSLNEDKPYDRFIFEQIAGDAVAADAALGFLVAGPANLPGQIGRDEAAMRQARQDELDEVIKTVSESLFGLTIGCARCHNHKFDPITQHDYYAMQAIFSGLKYGDRRLRGVQNDQWTAKVPAAEQRVKQLQSELEQLRIDLGLRPALMDVQSEVFAPVEASAVRMRIDATHNGASASLWEFQIWTPDQQGQTRNVALASTGAQPSASSFALVNQTRHFDNLVDGSTDRRQSFGWEAAQGGPAWIHIRLSEATRIDQITWHEGYSTPVNYQIDVLPVGSTAWKTVAHTSNRLPRVNDSRAAADVQLDGVSVEDVARVMTHVANLRKAQTELSRLAAGPRTYAARFDSEPEPTWLLVRGDPLRRKGQVAPAVPAILGPASAGRVATEVGRRVSLAHHLTRPDHPLTARVMVNRIWQHHFGNGLVETPSDFGKMGAEPSHPDLLDWLGSAFVESGWSMKRLHELIVTSQTYRQSSSPNPRAQAIDSGSRLLWRYPPRRLDAEVIRDSILAISGRLNRKMGGRGFDFFDQRGGLSDYTVKETFEQEGWRRMIYAHKIRMQAVGIFGDFDCPDAGQMQPRRPQSVTPLQSLGLFNSPFIARQAEFFADRVGGELRHDQPHVEALDAMVDRCFLLALARFPTTLEQQRLVRLAAAHGLEVVCRVLFNSSEFVFYQ